MAGNTRPPSTPAVHATARADTHKRDRAADGAYDRAVMHTPCFAWNQDPEACIKTGRGEAHSTSAQKLAHI